MTDPALIAAWGDYGVTQGMLDNVELPGIRIERLSVEPIIGAYRRMIRDLEFDVAELAPTTYLIARAQGLPITALPVFLSRKFHHRDVVVRADAGIGSPKDLEGKRFGLRAYTVTTAVWIRGLLHHHGVDTTKIRWVVDDEEHVQGIPLPPNVEKLPAGESVADRFAAGDLQAALRGNAGVGRRGNPTGGWQVTAPATAADDVVPLFAEPDDAAATDYATDRICPLHRTIVVRHDVLDRYPELPAVLFDRFVTAKRAYLERLGTIDDAEARGLRALAELVGPDPLPYGLDANLPSITELADLAKRDGLLAPDVDPRSMFLDLNPAG
jgi:4,5-dihydroxyphthalate decarboxylase